MDEKNINAKARAVGGLLINQQVFTSKGLRKKIATLQILAEELERIGK